MTALIAWLHQNPLYVSAITLFFYHAVSAAVGSLEMPDATSGKFYRWFFKFANRLAANYSRAAASHSNGGNGANPAA